MNQQHGAMTVGKDVTDAYNMMEKLEHTARVVLAARLQGPLSLLLEAEEEKLRQLREKYKGGGEFFICRKLVLRTRINGLGRPRYSQFPGAPLPLAPEPSMLE